VPGPARRQRPLTNTTNTPPPSRSYLGGDEGSLGEAATVQLANEGLPEGGLESSGAQEAPVFLVPEGLTFYDVPDTDPDGRGAIVTVVLKGGDDEGYTY
jgi:hypothetical protein